MCLPHLIKSSNPHIVNISPPLNMNPIWFKNHVAYTMAKYGMSMCVLGMAEEFKAEGVAVNAVWPRTGAFSSDFATGIYHSIPEKNHRQQKQFRSPILRYIVIKCHRLYGETLSCIQSLNSFFYTMKL